MKGMSNKVYRSLNSEMLLIREIDKRYKKRRLTITKTTSLAFVSQTVVHKVGKVKHRAR